MKKIAVIILHVGYWAMYLFLLFVFFVLNAATQQNFDSDKWQFFLNWAKLVSAFAIVPGIIGFYGAYAILYKQYLIKRQISALFISGFILAILSGCVGVVLMSLLFGLDSMFVDGWNSFIPEMILMCFVAAINCIIGLVLKGFISAYADIKWKEDLNKKNYEMELAMIKSQINPHFLFNTLNNIDALIQKDQEAASAYLNKLSDILRFILYETKSEKIPLTQEILFIEKYIELQRIRSSNPDAIRLIVDGEIGKFTIEPLLFIPIIENAFTHTQFRNTENSVYIHFIVKDNDIEFICKNYFNRSDPKTKEYGGLGMELIRKRLILLYPSKHILEINMEGTMFVVKLKVFVNEDVLHNN